MSVRKTPLVPRGYAFARHVPGQGRWFVLRSFKQIRRHHAHPWIRRARLRARFGPRYGAGIRVHRRKQQNLRTRRGGYTPFKWRRLARRSWLARRYAHRMFN